MAKLGVGIVGCGHNGGNHARVWSTIEEAAIVGVYDVNDAAAAERAGELGVRAFASLEEMVAEPAVEAVDVVTSGSHRDTAVIAAEAGKHVMVENPFSVTVREADDMIAAAERSGINLMYAQTWRFMPYGAKTRQLIEAGEIGDPVSITAAFITERVRRGLLWHRQLSEGGGFFMYEGTHFFDQVKWLMGSEIETVYAAGLGTYLLEGDGEDNGLATYRFENGTFGTLHNGSSNPGARIAGWTIVGTGGIIDVKDETVRLGKGRLEDRPDRRRQRLRGGVPRVHGEHRGGPPTVMRRPRRPSFHSSRRRGPGVPRDRPTGQNLGLRLVPTSALALSGAVDSRVSCPIVFQSVPSLSERWNTFPKNGTPSVPRPVSEMEQGGTKWNRGVPFHVDGNVWTVIRVIQ